MKTHTCALKQMNLKNCDTDFQSMPDIQKTRTYLPTNEYPSRTPPHPQAIALPARTLAVPPLHSSPMNVAPHPNLCGLTCCLLHFVFPKL